MIVTGWFAIQFPVLVKLKDGEDITFYNASAPQQTQFYLFIALVVGVVIVFPSMFYLYKTFKFEKPAEK
jgi:cytochrome d ubiquinol oxidase subunit II